MFRNLPLPAFGLACVVALVLHEATVIHATGAVRANNILTWLDMLGSIANILGFVCIAWGGPSMIMGFKQLKSGKLGAMKTLLFGAVCAAGGLAIVSFTCWVGSDSSCGLMFS